jgi:hypothetical protein
MSGYLGKISAIVTANTADFQAKLEGGGAAVRKFSREVQSNITKSMGDVEKSIQSIYTPLQRLEGSLKAAGSLKLSFQGFKGAIKDVEELKGRLGSLNSQQLKIVLDQSGLKSLKEVRSVLREVSNRDIRLFDAAGSLQALQKIQAGLNTARGQRKLAKLGIDESELDALIQKFRRFPRQRIEAVIDVLGQDMLDASFTKARQLFSLSEQINKPLMAAVDSFGKLSREVQAGFIPALGAAQNEAQNLADDIKNACVIGQGRFDDVESSVQRVTVAIKQLSEASALVGSLKTGNELAFDQPGLNAALTRGVKFGNDAQSQMAVSGIARANSGDVSNALQRIMAESKRAEAILADLKSAEQLGLSGYANGLRKDLADVAAEINKVLDVAETKIDLQVTTTAAKAVVDQLGNKLKELQALADFSITGNFQDSQQTVSAIQEIIGMMDKLNAAQKTAMQPQINSLIDAARPDASTGVVDLAKFKSVYDVLKADIEAGTKLNLDTTAAQKAIDDFAAKIKNIEDDSNFAITAQVQNQAQAEAEIKKLIGRMSELDAAGRAAMQPTANAAISSLSAKDASGAPDIDAMQLAIDAFDQEFNAQRTLKLDTAAATKRLDTLDESWAASIRGLPETEKQIDDFFTKVLSDIGKFEAADRLNFDPMIASIRQLIASGAPISSVADALLQLEDAQKKVNAAGKQGETVAKLSPGAVRTDLEQRLEAAKQRATNPMAMPGESVEDIGKEADVRLSLGKDIGDSARQLDVLKGGLTSVKDKVDRLPESVRSRFIPAIQDAEREITDLATSASPLAADIERARQRLAQLTQDASRADKALNFRESFGGAGGSGVNLGLDQRALKGYEGQLTALQTALGRTSAAARGPAVAAFNDLRNAISDAMDEGTLSMPATQQNIQRLTNVAVNATSQAGGGSVGTIQRDMQRAGDIGRGGFDNLSLAANQAAFAIDDFMSSTGGIDQKLRAVSNNVTQLAFVLGGTYGLWIGLGAVLAGQVAVGLVKYINGGRTAEDQTKSLNEAIARQKSLVEELAQAFESLGESLADGLFSDTAEKAREFSKQIENIQKKQKDIREGAVANADRGVQEERANQAKLTRELEAETDPGRRVAIQRQMDESVRVEKQAKEAALAVPTPAGVDVQAALESSASEIDETRKKSGRYNDYVRAIPGVLRNTARGVDAGGGLDARMSQAAAVSDSIDVLKPLARETNAIGLETAEAKAAREEIAKLEVILQQLNLAIATEVDDFAVSVSESSRAAADTIRNAQVEVAEAIKAGLPGARLFGLELDKNAQALADAQKKLKEASEDKEKDPDKKKELVDAAKAEVDSLNAKRAAMQSRADAYRYERIVDPQRQVDARMERAKSNLGDAGLEGGQIARRMREIENQRETISQRAAMSENQNPIMQGFFEGQQAALNAEVAAIEASTIALKMFSDALNRASEEAKSNLNSAQSAADEARREDLGNSTPEAQAERRGAAADLERQRELEKEAQRELANQRAREEEIKRGPEFQRMQQIDEQLASGSLSAAEQEQLRAERAGLEAKVEPQLQAGRERAEKAVEASTREEEERKSAARGRELRKTPEEKFAKETEQGLKDIREAFGREAENNGGIVDTAGRAEAERRYKEDREKEARTATMAGRGREAFMTDRERFSRDSREGIVKDMTAGAIDQAGLMNMQGRGDLLNKGLKNQMEEVAPMLQGFEEERQNARIQGPSRAALQMTDVSTSQGASELTRLIRGDDSAKDVNLAELRKQTSKFDDLIQAVRDANPGVLL